MITQDSHKPTPWRRVRRAHLCAGLMIIVVFLSSLTARAASPAPAFDEANASYASGNYHAAIAQYQAILAHDGFSAPVLFNLGNACYRDGQYGNAILNFERAQVLAPRDAEIAANLRLARQKADVSAPALNEIEAACRFLSPNTLAWIGSIALTAICVAIGLGRLVPQLPYIKVVGAVAAVTLLAVAATLAIRWPQFDRAIVIAANAPARIAPASTAADSFTLKAGEPIRIMRSYGRFLLARTSDGKSGWVSAEQVGRVFQSDSAGTKQGKA